MEALAPERVTVAAAPVHPQPPHLEGVEPVSLGSLSVRAIAQLRGRERDRQWGRERGRGRGRGGERGRERVRERQAEGEREGERE